MCFLFRSGGMGQPLPPGGLVGRRRDHVHTILALVGVGHCRASPLTEYRRRPPGGTLRGPLPRAPALPAFLPLTHLLAGSTAPSWSLNHLHRRTACAPDAHTGSEKEGDWLKAAPHAALPSTARCPAVWRVSTGRPSFTLSARLLCARLHAGCGGPGGKRTPGCREPRLEPKKPRGRPLRPRLWGRLALGPRAAGLDRAGCGSAVQSQ